MLLKAFEGDDGLGLLAGFTTATQAKSRQLKVQKCCKKLHLRAAVAAASAAAAGGG